MPPPKIVSDFCLDLLFMIFINGGRYHGNKNKIRIEYLTNTDFCFRDLFYICKDIKRKSLHNVIM